MTSDSSIQFQEPARQPHVSDVLHSSSNTADSAAASASTQSAPPIKRQGSVSKMAEVAKHLVKSPVEEKEHMQLEKTLSKEAKKGEADVSVMEA